MVNLYHRQVFWKKDFDVESAKLIKTVNRFSKHLEEYFDDNSERRQFDATSIMNIIDRLKTFDNIKAFEVETDGHELTKCVVRVGFNGKKDISLVFRKGLVVTAWLCDKDDNHKTLDKSKYEKREF